jgi:glyoxylase-like metal-dependent hydrolase (beta-lactamase superfamily II)/rhodanese-related sulfurtransferase
MQPIQLFEPTSSTYTYLLFDEVSREALIIDPVDSMLERDLAVLRQYGLTLRWTIETHAHADHITSAGQLAELAGARTAVPANCGISGAAVQLNDGAVLNFGSETLLAMHTPGHTAGSMSFLWRGNVFTGDTLLINGCGRTDFQSGSAAALYDSLTKVLFALPDETLVWPGHDYNAKTHSSIAAEKAGNARIAGKTQAQFVATMETLNLPAPKRLNEAVPANLRSGLRHDAQDASLTQSRPADGYAGDVSPQLAFDWMQSGEAVLIDIRTDAEREWVGFVPGAVPLSWKTWPGMALNSEFEAGLKAAVPAGKKAVLLCRSGVRSIAAAKCAKGLGIEAYNILQGFEGDPDENAQRGRTGGWRMLGLPWRQG